MSEGSGSSLVSIDDWELYPEGIHGFDPFEYDAQELRDRLNVLSPLIFSEKDTSIELIDALAEKDYKSLHVALLKEEDALSRLAASSPDLRIISILRDFSLSPLMISRELLLKILRLHNVGPSFLDLLPSFRIVDELSEKGNSLWTARSQPQGQIELCYIFKYMERNNHGQGQAWSERQIGVYHRFGTKGKAVMLLLHASTDTKALRRLRQVFANGQYSEQSETTAFLLHVLVLSSYLDNWRAYLQELGAWCLKKEDQFLVVGLKHPSLCFQELQDLRDLQSRLLIASGILQSSMSLIEGLQACCRSLVAATSICDSSKTKSGPINERKSLASEVDMLAALDVKCKGYSQSVDLIQRRVNVVIGLLSDGLNQQSQETANNIADSSYALTQKSVNDSYIVKVVTVITVVYLPMQGVATFFGMNLTSHSNESNKLSFADNWWLFLITAGPLTLVTLGGLWIAWKLEKKRKAKLPQELISKV